MSESVISTIIYGASVLLASVITLIITQWSNARSQARRMKERLEERRDDYREWYRRTLFEKRLEAVREAHVWQLRLFWAVGEADYSNPDSEANTLLRQTADDMQEWFDYNKIYIHDGFPGGSEFKGLTSTALAYANGRTDRTAVGGFDHFYLLVSNMIRERAQKLLELESEHRQPDEQ